MARRSIKFNDVTLRDGQQSIAATRMSTAQALRVLHMLEEAGFTQLELWGGAVPDSCVRFLNEDPWERLESFAEVLGGREKLRALLRGQNLFAYQPFPDDLVIAFIKQAVRSGVGNMRVFDALNDWRNLQIPMLASKGFGAKVEAGLCYTVSPVHTPGYFVDLAKKFEQEGADRIALKDIAGLLHPTDALPLMQALKRETSLPITFHAHSTTGVGLLDAVIAMQVGVEMIDCTITPFAGGTAHPPVELLLVFAERMGIEHNIQKELVLELQAELFQIFEELRDSIPYSIRFYQPFTYEDIDLKLVDSVIDLVAQETCDAVERAIPLTRELMHKLHFPDYDDRLFDSQIPGGMLSNLQNQLKGMRQEHILDQVMEEIPRVREDMGWVTLVTPTSQIIGSQAAFNVITGQRYAVLSNESKMLLRGEFGRPPAPFNPDLVQRALADGGRLIEYRPASYLEPVMEKEYDLSFVKTHKDLLLHLMLGGSADAFLKRKYGLET